MNDVKRKQPIGKLQFPGCLAKMTFHMPDIATCLWSVVLCLTSNSVLAARPGPALAPPILVAGRQLAVPTMDQIAWQNLEFGMFIHIAPQTWQDSESDTLATPAEKINPEKLDTEQWVRVAESMGATYIVFVAKHEGGFCWWQTDTTDFSIKKSPWRNGTGDVLRDLSASCRKHDLKLGVYLSPHDRIHGVGVGGRAENASKQADYERLFRTQLTEILSRYGEMVEVWFDGSLAFDVGDILSKHAPHAAVFQGPEATIRWVGNEEGIAPVAAWNAVRSGKMKWGDYTARQSDPDGDRWLPNECDARIRATWFWHSDNQKTLKSVKQLVEMYEKSVGRGANLLLNNTPDRSGLIPESDVLRAREFGDSIREIYGPGTSIADVSGKGREFTVQPSAPAVIDRVVMMEDISQGERIRAYRLEGLGMDGSWTLLSEGHAVGHKRIERFEPTRLSSVLLRVTESVGEPILRRLSLHRASRD
jgi:alpha-L-fucosidase